MTARMPTMINIAMNHPLSGDELARLPKDVRIEPPVGAPDGPIKAMQESSDAKFRFMTNGNSPS